MLVVLSVCGLEHVLVVIWLEVCVCRLSFCVWVGVCVGCDMARDLYVGCLLYC